MNVGKFWLAVAQALTIAGIVWIARSERDTAVSIAVLKEQRCQCLAASQSHAATKSNRYEN